MHTETEACPAMKTALEAPAHSINQLAAVSTCVCRWQKQVLHMQPRECHASEALP